MAVKNPETILAWVMTSPGENLEKRSLPFPIPDEGEFVIQVAGCGLCHTDLAFLFQGVKTRAALPMVLGHEVSGIVVSVGAGADANWMGKPVIVPAVLPCGTCPLCASGHRRICHRQIMPGNDKNGGFATHLCVPARYVCPVPADLLRTHELWELSIVADAVTTPFQAVKRSGLAAGDLAVVIGAGGIGVHAVQIAAASGAFVIALDVDERRLALALASGAKSGVNVSGLTTKEVRARVGEEAKRLGAPSDRWRIYETSGTRAGQETAFSLVVHGADLSIVGFTMDRLEVRLSNLMAYDASMRGNWGCDPVLYPEVLDWIADGRIQLKPFIQKYPLDEINDLVQAAHHGGLPRRAVLVP